MVPLPFQTYKNVTAVSTGILTDLRLFLITNYLRYIFRCTVTTKLDNATATVPVRIIVNAPVIVNHSEDQVGPFMHPFFLFCATTYYFLLLFFSRREKVLFSGNTISLLCKANGIPAPQIHWKFNETSTKQIGEDYVISNAMMVDSGIYSCEASNQYGKTKYLILYYLFVSKLLF